VNLKIFRSIIDALSNFFLVPPRASPEGLGWVRRAGRFYGGGWIFFEGGFVVFYWGFWKKRVAKRGVCVVSLWWNVW
jgi:hypothetical protein